MGTPAPSSLAMPALARRRLCRDAKSSDTVQNNAKSADYLATTNPALPKQRQQSTKAEAMPGQTFEAKGKKKARRAILHERKIGRRSTGLLPDSRRTIPSGRRPRSEVAARPSRGGKAGPCPAFPCRGERGGFRAASERSGRRSRSASSSQRIVVTGGRRVSDAGGWGLADFQEADDSNSNTDKR